MNKICIKINGKIITPQKAIINPKLGSKNVLTNSRWEFVELYLRKEKQTESSFYWNQAKEFNKAAYNLSIQASPLLHYYSFMNATKALLSSKGITFNPYHGVKAGSQSNRRKISLSNESIKVQTQGVLPSLSQYYKETESSRQHTLQEIFFNLPYIHRTYCLSYPSQIDAFIPLIDCEFVKDSVTNETYFLARLSKDFSNRSTIKKLPTSLIIESTSGPNWTLRSAASIFVNKPTSLTFTEKSDLIYLHQVLRRDLLYNNGSHTLWYAKGRVTGPKILNRFPTTLTLTAMHRLSELCRYKPIELNAFLGSQKNWLISEFVQQSPNQFLDEMASEITGYQFLQPNIRMAS